MFYGMGYMAEGADAHNEMKAGTAPVLPNTSLSRGQSTKFTVLETSKLANQLTRICGALWIGYE